MELKKYDIINFLGKRYELRSYLELCTPSTGLTFSEIDQVWFEKRHRLVYRCPANVSDGDVYTFRTEHDSSRDITATIFAAKDEQAPYDLIFVDPWHTLEASREDLDGAWKLLQAGGMMVVHDCNPPDADYASPQFRPYGWCGETYRAYIDFVAFRTDADFCTVDTDYGCAVIRKAAPGEPRYRHDERLLEIWLRWSAASSNPEERYAVFDRYRSEILRLVSVEQFLESHNLLARRADDGASLVGTP